MAVKKWRKVLHNHSLGIVSIAILILWIVLYCFSSEDSHAGAFFGNAVADWSGSVVIIFGTKFLLENRSAESKKVSVHARRKVFGFMRRHSLSLFLAVTGIGWAIVFCLVKVDSKWGQVVGNILSEWVQMSGLVFMTKGLIEKGSKESR